ncbi:MAG: hypothetical protein IRZ14_07030 [Chloroflexi bacterium]|jgi:hypothetical protein|nr:hypothetical protein [Chloroflexota bacterium]
MRPRVDIPYDQLPAAVKHNLSREQWLEAQRGVILEGQSVPDTTQYIDLKSGQCRQYIAGEVATGPLLPTHDLAGGRGADSTQFRTTPPGSHHAP